MTCFIVFIDVHIWFATRIKSLAEIFRKLVTIQLSAENLTAILFYADKKNSPRGPVGSQLILVQEGSVNMNQS